MKTKGSDYIGITELSQKLGIQPHVLRYWEMEFPMLAPVKTFAGKRRYSENDVQIAKRIKDLLYDEQFTVSGAKRRLDSELARAKSSRTDLIAKILLVDSDIQMTTLLAEYLGRLNYEIITAANAEEGLRQAQKRPDLVILDLGQSKHEQITVIRAIAGADIPVMVLSAHDLLDDKVAVFEAGATDFLAKPFSPRELEYRITALLRRPQRENQDPPDARVTKPKPKDPYRLLGEVVTRRYELVEYAGGGGMGAVYKAIDRFTNNNVAIKILKPDVAERDAEYARLFEQEVRATQKLLHEHIVRVSDSGVQDGISFMVMEWVEGKSLEEVIATEKLSLERIRLIFADICDAINFAHEQRILHLDIKPANIFLRDQLDGSDFVKVFDFGLARIISRESGTTVTRFRGTHQYCAPEQFGGRVNRKSDIYSLGATLYHLISGVVPFSSTYISAKIHPNLELPTIPSLTKYRNLPVKIDEVLARALAKDPKLRQESAQELFEEFANAIALDVPSD